MKPKVWYKWPEGYLFSKSGSATFPWYTILRRLLFIVPVFLFGLLTYLSLWLGYGKDEADYVVNNGW